MIDFDMRYELHGSECDVDKISHLEVGGLRQCMHSTGVPEHAQYYWF